MIGNYIHRVIIIEGSLFSREYGILSMVNLYFSYLVELFLICARTYPNSTILACFKNCDLVHLTFHFHLFYNIMS